MSYRWQETMKILIPGFYIRFLHLSSGKEIGTGAER